MHCRLRVNDRPTLGLCVEFGPSLARLSDSGCVDERSNFLRVGLLEFLVNSTWYDRTNEAAYLDIRGHQAVEEVDVGGAEHGKVLVLLNRRLARSQNCQSWQAWH